jgi:hypothetical protein
MYREIIYVYSDSHMKQISVLCGQSAELLITKADGTCINLWAVKC